MDGMKSECFRISERTLSSIDQKSHLPPGRMSEHRGSSSTAQLRKIKKPLIEKRRRERINECLGQLKSLVLEAMNKDESRYSRMEKADILEMTVEHLKLARQHRGGSPRFSEDDQIPPAYALGFNECIQHVNGYLSEQRDVTTNVAQKSVAPLVSHLGNVLNSHFNRTNEQETPERYRGNSTSPESGRMEDSGSAVSEISLSPADWISYRQPRYLLARLVEDNKHQYGFEVPSSLESDERAQLDYRSSCGASLTSNESGLTSYGSSDPGCVDSYHQNRTEKVCPSDHSDSGSQCSPSSPSSTRSASHTSDDAQSFFTTSALYPPSPLALDESSRVSPLLTNVCNSMTLSSVTNIPSHCSQPSTRTSSIVMHAPASQVASWRPW